MAQKHAHPPQQPTAAQWSIMIIVGIVSVILTLVALFQLYQHSKTDGYGNGWIKVSTCKEQDWAWKIYRCQGGYHSGAGLIETEDVSVKVTGYEPKRDAIISDVYPVYGSKADAHEFVTGKERSSVVYNIPWLTLLFVAIVAPIGLWLYIAGQHLTNRREDQTP